MLTRAERYKDKVPQVSLYKKIYFYPTRVIIMQWMDRSKTTNHNNTLQAILKYDYQSLVSMRVYVQVSEVIELATDASIRKQFLSFPFFSNCNNVTFGESSNLLF